MGEKNQPHGFLAPFDFDEYIMIYTLPDSFAPKPSALMPQEHTKLASKMQSHYYSITQLRPSNLFSLNYVGINSSKGADSEIGGRDKVRSRKIAIKVCNA